jgi:murein DD-endopeptidase
VRYLRPVLLPFVLLSTLSFGCSHQPTPRSPVSNNIGDRAAEIALTMVGKPYRYGGNTPGGFDCSGLVHYSYGRAGVNVPRSTKTQMRQSRPIPLNNLRRGDLLFFDQEGKKSSHVAIYVGSDRFVHAPSSGKRVYVGDLQSRYWRRHLAGARRLDVY